MNRALQQYEVNLQGARQLGIIYLAFSDKVTEAICLDELLRAEIVLSVSALDCYVHDLVRIGMTREFTIPTTTASNAFLNFGVSLGFVKSIIVSTSDADKHALIDQEIRRLHGFRTFQTADNIAQSLSLIGITAVWDKVGSALGMPAVDVKTRLNIIVDRRNRIAHEGDINPTMGIGVKYAIDFSMVRDAVNFVDSLVHTIHAIALS